MTEIWGKIRLRHTVTTYVYWRQLALSTVVQGLVQLPHQKHEVVSHTCMHTHTHTTHCTPLTKHITLHKITTKYKHHHHHHTVQVAKLALCMCAPLVNAWLVEENTTSASCSGRWKHICKSCVRISKWYKKNTIIYIYVINYSTWHKKLTFFHRMSTLVIRG